MTLTVLDVAGYVRRRLDGEPSVPMVTLCNQAGDYLANMHGWGWLVRKPASLNLVAGRTSISLPDDFGRALGRPRSQGSGSFQWGTLDEVTALRAGSATASSFVGAIVWVTDINTGTIKPQIELSAEASTTETGAFLLPYVARWTEIVSDEDLFQIPSFIEPLYLEIVFAFAQGYDEHDLSMRDERLALIRAGDTFMSARRRDGGAQPSLGQMTGGAVQMLAARQDGIEVSPSGVAADPV